MFVSLIRLLLRLTAAKFSPRNLNHRLRRHCTAPGAAFLIQKIQYFPQRVCIRGVPQERPLAPHLHQPHLLQLFQMVRECRSRYAHLFLHLSHHHPLRMRRQQQPQNLQARLRAQRRKPRSAAGNQSRLGLLHISIIAEIRKKRQPPPTPNLFGTLLFRHASYSQTLRPWKPRQFAFDPKSPVIGERLAEMYWKAQRTHDAVAEAQEILKRHPDDVPTRRLLGRIYLRSLGDLNAGVGQSEVAGKAIEQYKEIYRLDPSDTESALWLTRLYRLRNEHDQAEAVLRGILKDDPENEPAVEQLIQLLLDEG